MFNTILNFLNNYSYIIVIIMTFLIVIATIKYIVTHVPSGGKITELYDREGNKNEKKLPENVSRRAFIFAIILILLILYMFLEILK